MRYHLEHAFKGEACVRGETVAPIPPATLEDESGLVDLDQPIDEAYHPTGEVD